MQRRMQRNIRHVIVSFQLHYADVALHSPDDNIVSLKAKL